VWYREGNITAEERLLLLRRTERISIDFWVNAWGGGGVLRLFITADERERVKCGIAGRGSHGGNYEECRLLGYKNPVRTAQETHYVSATQPVNAM
jgi:hypothetical protein